jgi:hypothetical protein
MRNKLSARVLLLLIALSLTLSLFACDGGVSDREYDEAVVLASANELIKKSKTLNELYYGKGYEYDKEKSNGIYCEATTESTDHFGIHSVAELKIKTLEVFSDSLSNMMFSTVLSSIVDDEISHYARYYDTKPDSNGKVHIMVNKNYEYYLKGSIEYLDGIYVKDVEGEEIILAVPVILTSESGKTKQKELEVRMIEEEDGWRLSSATDAVYNENSDIYEDMLEDLK